MVGFYCNSNKISTGNIEEIETNDKGGQQSKLETRCDLLPASAVKEVASVLKFGADKYAPDNWRLIDCESHLNHAQTHLLNFMDKNPKVDFDKREELSHFACRALMALEMYLHG